MAMCHTREEAARLIATMPEQCFVDGLLLDVPKRRRREQAMGTAMVRIQWPKEQKKRFATQYNRYVETCSKELGIELLLRKAEEPTDDELRAAVETGELPKLRMWVINDEDDAGIGITVVIAHSEAQALAKFRVVNGETFRVRSIEESEALTLSELEDEQGATGYTRRVG